METNLSQESSQGKIGEGINEMVQSKSYHPNSNNSFIQIKKPPIMNKSNSQLTNNAPNQNPEKISG